MSGSAGNRIMVTVGADTRLLTNGMRDAAAAVERGAGQMTRATATLNRTNQAGASAAGGFSSALSGLTQGFASSLLPLASAAAAVGALTAGWRAATAAAEQFERLGMKTEAIIRSTGGTAGMTAADIRTMSQELARGTLASAEGAEAAAQKLLTFRNISGDVFGRTLKAAQDLAAVGFGSLDSAATQLGKALEDPVKGVSALAEVGVSFTAGQRDVIKSLVDTGQAAEAQRLILAAVEQQVGGAGAGEAGGLTGAYDSLGQSVQEFLVRVGNLGPLQLATSVINVLAKELRDLDRVLARLTGTDPAEVIAGRAVASAQKGVDAVRAQAAAQASASAYGLTAAEKAAQDQAVEIAVEALQAAEIKLVAAQEDIERGRVEASARGADARAMIERDAAASALASLRASYDKRIGVEAAYTTEVATIRRAQAAGELTAAQATDELTLALKRRDAALEAAVPKAKKEKAEKPSDDMLIAAKAAEEFEKAHDAAAKAADRVMNSLDPARAALSAYTANVDALKDALRAGAITQDEFTASISLAEKSYSDAQSKMADTGKATDEVFAKLESSFEAALTSGKSLGDVFKALTDDLAKLIIKLTITEPLARAVKAAFAGSGGASGVVNAIGAAIFGAPAGATPATVTPNALGGIMTSEGPVPLRKYSRGGIASSPQMALFGEGSGSEAFVPLPDGRRIPVKMEGGGGSTVVHIDARGADAGIERRIDAAMARAAIAGAAMGEQRVYTAVGRGGSAARMLGAR